MVFSNVKTLVLMQLKDKLDFSFAKTKRGIILKVALSLIKFLAVTAVFFLLFYICKLLKVFSFFGELPDTVIGVAFTIIEIMAIFSCTVGLTKTLYMTADNKVLLTLPVSASEIFTSKLILYFIFEVKRNIFFTLPMFVAYGIVTGAIWLYYPWLMICFVFISLLPVLLGAVLSIPSLYIATFVSRYKWLQALIAIAVCAVITFILVKIINAIPTNINILGQWGSIFTSIQNFLNTFCKFAYPFYMLTIMIVGGTLRIAHYNLFGIDTLIIFVALLFVLATLFVVSFLVAKPLFFKMASKQFEFEKMVVPPKKNRLHSPFISPYSEVLKMIFRDTNQIVSYAVQLVLPALALLLLNKIYAAMNTSYVGGVMTKTFNLLVLLVISLAFNAKYATIYSQEAQARNILKTRPQLPLNFLFSRLFFRAIIAVCSVVVASVIYSNIARLSITSTILFSLIGSCITVAHLLWSAELDVMNSQADQYSTIGVDYNNPNETKATIIAFVLAVLFTFFFYFFTDRGVDASLIKCSIIAVVFLIARIYLYTTRVKLFFKEK